MGSKGVYNSIITIGYLILVKRARLILVKLLDEINKA